MIYSLVLFPNSNYIFGSSIILLVSYMLPRPRTHTIKHSIIPAEIIKAHIAISDHLSDSAKQLAIAAVVQIIHTITEIKNQSLSDI